MSFVGRIIGTVLRPLVERQAKGRSLGDLAEALDHSGSTLNVRFGRAAGTLRNRVALNHIVGIERWGQRRLRVPLGESLLVDSYRSYRLPEGSSMGNLVQAFTDTRWDTINLARELTSANLKSPVEVRNIDLGELSIRAWLAYLDPVLNGKASELEAGGIVPHQLLVKGIARSVDKRFGTQG